MQAVAKLTMQQVISYKRMSYGRSIAVVCSGYTNTLASFLFVLNLSAHVLWGPAFSPLMFLHQQRLQSARFSVDPSFPQIYATMTHYVHTTILIRIDSTIENFEK